MKNIGYALVGLTLGTMFLLTELSAQTPIPQQAQAVPPIAKPEKPLVFQNKTFEEWVGSPRKELDENYLKETIRALRAFGLHGRGKEAAQAVYDMMEGKNFSGFYVDQPSYLRTGESVSTEELAIRAVAGMTSKETLPMLMKLLNGPDQNDRMFVYQVFFVMDERRLESRVPQEALFVLLGQALQKDSWSPLNSGLTWPMLLGKCDPNGDYVLKYLRELVRRNDAMRFNHAFNSIMMMAQAAGGPVWYDWELNINDRRSWYPSISNGPGKGTPKTISEHGKALLRFFKDEGAKSENVQIRNLSLHLAAKLEETVRKWEPSSVPTRPVSEAPPTTLSPLAVPARVVSPIISSPIP